MVAGQRDMICETVSSERSGSDRGTRVSLIRTSD